MDKAAELLLNYGVLGILCALLIFGIVKAGKWVANQFILKYEAAKEQERIYREQLDKQKEAALTKALDDNAKRLENIAGSIKSMHEETQRRDHQTELEKREWAGKVFTQIERIAAELSDFATTVRNHDVEIRLLKEGLERHAREIEKILKHINV